MEENRQEKWNPYKDLSLTKEIKMIIRCNKFGFTEDDIGKEISVDGASYNASEFEKIYLEERKRISRGESVGDSFMRSVKRYLKVPMLVSIVSIAIAQLFLFAVKVTNVENKTEGE